MDYIDTNCPKSKRSKYFKISEYAWTSNPMRVILLYCTKLY
jgi:hypothetical protein